MFDLHALGDSHSASEALEKGLGISPVINALGPASQLGCATLSNRVTSAMAAASKCYIPLNELQEQVSAELVRLLDCEAGCAASGGAACLEMAAAACIARDRLDIMDALPDTLGAPNEIIIHRSQRSPFDHAARAAGARFIEIGYPGSGSGVHTYNWQLESAFSERTAAVYWVGGPKMFGVLPIEALVEAAHRHNVPVIADGAAEDIEGLRQLISSGVDLVAASGGKAIRGPAASGILAGRRDLIQYATMQQQDAHVHPSVWRVPLTGYGSNFEGQEPPHQGIARSSKIGREELVGLIVAIQEVKERDTLAERGIWRTRCDAIVENVIASDKVRAATVDSPRPDCPKVMLQFESASMARFVASQLYSGSPRIWADSMRVDLGQVWLVPIEMRHSDISRIVNRLSEIMELG